MREVQTEPRISVQLELGRRVGHGGLQLEIRNEGLGPAQDIRFEFSGDPTYFIKNGVGKPIDEIPVIKEGINYLGPGRDFSFVLGWLFGEDFNKAMDFPWTFHVSYENLNGRKRKETFVLDFSQFASLIVGAGDPLQNIQGHLDSIQKELRAWGTGFRKPQVITQTKEERRKEMEKLLQHQMGIPKDDSQTGSESST